MDRIGLFCTFTMSHRSARRALRTLVLFGLCLLAAQGLSATPGKINYQGILLDTDTGDPIEGTHTLTFRLFDQVESGTELWSESQMVEIGSSGVFSVILGSTNPIGLSFSAPYWLEVEVSGEVLAPRRELVSVPYSFRSMAAGDADSLGGVHSGDYVTVGEIGVITSDMIVGGPGSGLDADLLDGLDSDAFADSGHDHDDEYYTQDELNTGGTINDTANPVDWTRLMSVPAGFADGADDVGPGDGHSLDADDDSPVDALYVDSDGEVGIGTTAPSLGRLQVEAEGNAVYARSNTGTGVFAVRGEAVGGELVAAITGTSTWGTAIRGISSQGYGVYGSSTHEASAGVMAFHDNGGVALYASNESSLSPAVSAKNWTDGVALRAETWDGVGVWGQTQGNDAIGVLGAQAGYGISDIPAGYKPGGFFAGRNGVIGVTKEHAGYGVYGVADHATAYAGRFLSDVGHGVLISTPAGKTGLSVSGGTKMAVVATADGARSLYCEEASEVWFADYGFASLEGGVAVVAIDPVFAQTVNLTEPYHVFLQAYGDADLYVASRDGDGFEVRLRDGDPGVEFSYRLVAKRLGFEDKRLARAPWADNDTNVFPGDVPLRQSEE